MSRSIIRFAVVGGVLALATAGAIGTVGSAGASGTAVTTTTFSMVRSGGAVAAGCIPSAGATVTITNHGITETMDVTVSGLPPSSGFDLFVLQVPNAPFGVGWYQGDLTTDSTGKGHGQYVGRFSIETFALAPGTAVAPNIHPGKDATSNPAFAPIHMFHLGLWFDSPAAAAAAGCPNTVTPFNGEHKAGIQALSTRNFDDKHGPLRTITP